MKPVPTEERKADIKIEKLSKFKDADLNDLCEATERTILDNYQSFTIGSSREEPLMRERMEAYWKGVLMVPERQLIVGRLDGVIASGIQLVKPSPNNQTSSFSASLEKHFVAPWARGHGLAKLLVKAAEDEAKNFGISVLRISVRDNLQGAIKVYESCGYKCWGVLDKYEIIEGKMYGGRFYYKDI